MGNFSEKNHTLYNSRRGDFFYLPPAKSSRYGVNSVVFDGNFVWNNLPTQEKESRTLEKIKNRIKSLGYDHCSCTVCR